MWTTLALLAGLVAYAVHEWNRKTGAAASPTPPPSNPSGPRIQFATPVYDFGKVNGDDLVNCVFVFTNTGHALLEVSEVTPSCGCLKLGEWSRQVAPGRIGSIAVRYDSHHYTGHFAKSVWVTCNDANQPKVTLEITGNVWRPIEITPPTAVLDLSAESPSNAASVRIISHIEEPLTVSELVNTNRAFAAELQTNQPGKEYAVVVRTAPPWPTNSLQGRLTLKTSLTNMPEISVNAWANVRPVITAVPLQIRLPAPPLTNRFTASVWVQNNGTNVLALSEPTVTGKGVEVKIREDQPGKLITLTMTFPAGYEIAPGETAELSVKSNHPLFPVIKVPVLQTPRPVPAPAPPAAK